MAYDFRNQPWSSCIPIPQDPSPFLVPCSLFEKSNGYEHHGGVGEKEMTCGCGYDIRGLCHWGRWKQLWEHGLDCVGRRRGKENEKRTTNGCPNGGKWCISVLQK